MNNQTESANKADTADKTDKKPTSKSVLREVKRLRKVNEKRKEKLAELKGEITSDNAKIKELEKQYDTLCQEELQHKIATEWFKNNKLTDSQITKLLEVGVQIHAKIDELDTDEVIAAVLNASGKSAKSAMSEKPSSEVK